MKKMTQQEEATALKARFAKIKGQMSRPEFAKKFGVRGGDSMIYQHITGHRPIGMEAALAYSKGFQCSLEEISPRLADEARKSSLSLSSNMQVAKEQIESLENKGDAYMPRLASVTRLDKSDSTVIPRYDTGGAMGHGLVMADQPGVIEKWSVSREWLAKNIRSHSGVQNLCIVTGFGPSMQPCFNPGDPLLVDAGVKTVIADGIYFFRVGAEGYIKQLQKIPTERGLKYIAKSKNPDFDTFEITEGMDFEVLGKVVRVWCGTDF